MAVDFDTAITAMESLVQAEGQLELDRNEATTRLHIIDRLLFDCLGWDRSDARRAVGVAAAVAGRRPPQMP